MNIVRSEIEIPVSGSVMIKGNLGMPEGSRSLVIFSHGSGSSRFSVRNRFVAEYLNTHLISTLLIDLLTVEEDQEYQNRFDIRLLSERLEKVTLHMQQLPASTGQTIGYFGASTGAASALTAAAHLPSVIRAVVSRGGRPDLAAGLLGKVNAPTLLIVGSLDHEVIVLNRKALAVLPCEKKIEIVEGASHLFEEPGRLEIVAEFAVHWFNQYLK